MSTSISIAIVEDDSSYRQLLADLCDACSVSVRGTFDRADEAMRALPTLDPDIALIDLGLPDRDGAELIAALRQLAPRAQCVVLTKFDDDTHLFRALECGAVGYLLKDALDLRCLRSALDEVLSGGAPMSSSVARRVLTAFRLPQARAEVSALTDRESEILDQLAAGHAAKHVSRLLGISYETVRCHQKSIYKKLQVNSVVQAVARANAASSGRWPMLWPVKRRSR
jgi:two-component system, NarL family, response regulator LiaR